MSQVDRDEEIQKHGLERTDSGYITWQQSHGEHPRNWRTARKLYDTTLILFWEFYITIISTTGPSAATAAKKEFGINRTIALCAFIFTYQLGQALGSVVVPPFSESFGRRRPYICSASLYSVGCLITGIVPHTSVGVYIGRFISGFASAIPSVVVAGSVQDMFDGELRIWLILTWNSLTVLGLSNGPIYGAYIIDSFGWRWIYYSAAILSAALIIPLFFIRESRPTMLLQHKLDTIKDNTGDKSLKIHDNHDTIDNFDQFIKTVLIRPVRLGLTEPIIIMVTILGATACGLIYLFTESLTIVYEDLGFSETNASLAFLALAIGVFISILPRFYDIRIMHKREQKHQKRTPEDNLTGFAIAVPTLAIGLWVFAWTIPPRVHTHWSIPMLGLLLIGFATNEILYTLSGYLTESYSIFASSSLAAFTFTRALVSGCLPLFGYQMFRGLGNNVAVSILAGVATTYCIAPVVFLRYGRKLREKSQFARYSLKVEQESDSSSSSEG